MVIRMITMSEEFLAIATHCLYTFFVNAPNVGQVTSMQPPHDVSDFVLGV